MKLRTFNKTSRKYNSGGRVSIPGFSVNAKGAFVLNVGLVRMLNISGDDKFLIHQDLEYRNDWYLEITKSEDAFKPCFYKNQVKFSNVETAREIFKSFGKKPQMMKFSIKEKPLIFDGHILYSIIASDNKK